MNMKKLLFFISALAFMGCSTYTVKTEVPAKVAGEEMQAGECKEFSDDLFGIFGDFPITITDSDGEKIGDEESYPANHYIVKAGAVETSDTACVPQEDDSPKDEDGDDGVAKTEKEKSPEAKCKDTGGEWKQVAGNPHPVCVCPAGKKLANEECGNFGRFAPAPATTTPTPAGGSGG